MMEHKWMEDATIVAGKVYRKFLTEVLEAHVINDREGSAPNEISQKKIDKGTHIDPRVLRLMSISGKGGVAANPEKQKIYDKFYNVSLLDHLLSVTRGSLLLSALDWMGQNPDMDSSVLNRKLTVMAVIGFMHDLDKDLKLPRNAPLEIEDTDERMRRYGIANFLKGADVSLSASQLRYLVEKVEGTQAHRHAPDTLPPREFESLSRYVRLADQLDGTWLSSDPEKGGFEGVIRCLEKDRNLQGDILKKWKEICLFDPHHPFLLDELQRCLSRFSLRLTGVPPLIEVHQDGHLFMLIPENRHEEIVEKAVNTLCNSLPFSLYLNVSNRGVPSLYNGQPSHEELAEFIEEGLKSQDLSNLFKVKRDMVNQLKDPLDDLLADIGLQPRWAEKVTTQLTTLYATFKDFEETDKEWLYRAAHLVLLLNLKVDAKPKNAVPDSPEREAELLKIVEEEPPDWIKVIDKRASRRTLTGLWVTAMAEQDEDVLEKVWGDEGLLKQWLEGHEKRPGFNQFISGDGIEVLKGVKRRMNLLLSGQRVTVEKEKEKGRCLFTDEPVPFESKIAQATGLYGVKVSAFSGRDNRPELITSDQSHTNVGFSSLAEHKLRSEVHKLQGGKDNGVPTLISSPTTCGLFGGLGLTDDRAMGAMSLYDLNRLEIKKGKVLRGFETYQSRYRMARLERMPESLEGQVNIMRMLLNATRRTGRPIHIFRGLPILQKAYFYYDAMPKVLVNLLGRNALGLEDIPKAIRKLDIARGILETNGLGYDVLRLYVMQDKRFGAICLICSHLRDKKKQGENLYHRLYEKYLYYMEGNQTMSEQDKPLIKLGRAGAGIQKNPGGKASGSDEMLVFKLCMDTVNAARKVGQTDVESLTYALASELETNLIRRDKAAAKANRGKSLREGCMDVAEIFVNDLWFGILGGRSPSQKSRKVLSAIYRMAFLKTHKEISEKKSENKKENK